MKNPTVYFPAGVFVFYHMITLLSSIRQKYLNFNFIENLLIILKKKCFYLNFIIKTP